MTNRPSLSMRESATRFASVVCLCLLALLPLVLLAQAPAQAPAAPPTAPQSWADQILKQETYATPPPELATAVLAPRYLNVTLDNPSPDKRWFLDEIGDGPVVMKVFAKPFHELGGVFIDFKANRSRALTIRNNVGIQLISAADGSTRTIQVPPGARITSATWSPDGTTIGYFVHGDDATHIWLADVATGQSRQLTTTPVLATLVPTFSFSADGKHIATVLVPDGRAPMPAARPAAPTGPEVKLALGGKSSLRTFPSLMTTPHDFDLLEWHATGQIALIDVPTRAVKKIGPPTMVRAMDLSPDAQYLRVTRMVKPFSYIVPVNNFGSVEEVWDTTGKALAKLTDRPLNLGVVADDQTPTDPTAAPSGGGGRGGANQNGKRELAWSADGRGLTYLEQEPAAPGTTPASPSGRGSGGTRGTAGGGRGTGGSGVPQGPPRPDRVMRWLPPFDATSMGVIYENSTRMSSHRFSPDMQILFYTETVAQSSTDYAVYLSDSAQRYALARCRTDDFFGNPGLLVSPGRAGGAGRAGGGGGRGGGGCTVGTGAVLLSADGQSVFYQGTLYDKDPDHVGPRTFIDRVAIKTGEKTRIYESNNASVYERVSTILDPDARRFVVQHEGPTDPPQNYLVQDGTRKQITNNEDIAPDLTRAVKERFTIERPDGFHFHVKVTLPVGYQAGTRLPAIFWFYPAEFDTQEAYDRPDRTFNKNAFPNFGTRSMQFFVRLGYAVVEPDAPIVGPLGQQNNNYVNDLRNDLAAAIDDLDRRAIIDRTRLAIGGHSYGAFSTVNAMVNTPFFKAGIAGDGAYNRTLTPFGFQNERRTLWEARDVYLAMSPFLYANNLTGALLMYHGLADQNVGTDPINSERLFEALNEMGKTTAMYRYPLEDHGPAARETLLDLWARWAAWLDKYVKNPEKPAVKPAPTAGRGGGGR
jgi:dipeptidyl aminopeptidase/acylaminoacyl peptidase